MNKIQYDKEVDRLLNEAGELEEREQLGLDTAMFLESEAKKLECIIMDSHSTEYQKGSAIVKLEILYKRIQSELNYVNDNDEKSSKIEHDLNILNKILLTEGLTE